jgi:hypothetical protein
MPRGLFDLVIFDEAHHLPATTWKAMLDATDALAVLLTATPFRGDGHRLPGRIAYSYPLARAIDQGVFGPVSYRPVDSVDGENLHLTIAKAAATRLRSEEHHAAESRLLVRTDSVAHARELVDVYASVRVPLGLIVHNTTWKRAEQMRRDVEEGTLMGFVSVGALTEGFDFPTLKIGAYHAPHKTLGPTLQFVGRLSRSAPQIEAELLAPRSAVSDETAELYREDVAWRKLLPDLVDSAIDREREVRSFVEGTTVKGPLALSPLSLTPSRGVHVYRTQGPPLTDADPEKIAGAQVVQRIVHEESKTLAFVTRRNQRPPFMRLDTLDAAIYELHLMTWVEDSGVLFVATTTEPVRKDLLAKAGPASLRSLTGSELRQLLDAANYQRFFSIGTRAARAQSSRTSYQIRAGSKTEDDLTPADARGWDLGHGMGRSGDGTFGFSVDKSKVWEPGSADSLLAFRRWCEGQASTLAAEPGERRVSKLDLLGISEPLHRFPDDPVVALLPFEIFSHGYSLIVEGEIVLPELVELLPRSTAQDGELTLDMHVEGEVVASLRCRVDGTITDGGDRELLVQDPAEAELTPMSAYLEEHPPTIFFGTGARAIGERIADPPAALPRVAEEIRHPREWPSTAVTVEFQEPPEGESNVGTATAALLRSEMPLVVQDHLPGELADFIAIDATRLTPEIRLVHCKSSADPNPGARVEDVQELVAQAIRSVQWLSPRSNLWLEIQRRLREREATTILHDARDEADSLLAEWIASPPAPEWSIWLVQPGISNAAIDGSERVTSLLTAAHAWVSSQEVSLRLICSP